jgi:enoyl-CoA hydratase
MELPQQAVEATKRLMNIQLERSVMASLDYANLAEYVSFGTADFNKIVDGLIAKN